MDMKSPLVFSVVLGRWNYPIPPAHLLPVPLWSIAICKFVLPWSLQICLGLCNIQLFGRQPAILFPRLTCTLQFTAVVIRFSLLVVNAAVTVSALGGKGLPWCRLSVLYTLPLLHILEAAKGWSWAFDPVTYHFHLGFTCLITAAVFATIYIHANYIWDSSWWSLQHIDSKNPLMSVDWNAALASTALSSRTESGTSARSRHQMY